MTLATITRDTWRAKIRNHKNEQSKNSVGNDKFRLKAQEMPDRTSKLIQGYFLWMEGCGQP